MKLAIPVVFVVVTVTLFLLIFRPPSLVAPPQTDLILDGVTIVEPGIRREASRRIVVANGRIVSIDRAPADSGGVYAGMYVLPGLIDMHVHLPPRFAAGQLELFETLFLAHGVTTVRDMGSFGLDVGELRSRLRAGERAGPRLFTCLKVIDGDPPSWPGAVVVRDAGEGWMAVERLATAGADCVKVYSRIGDDALAGVADAARRRGLPLVGHLPASLSWTEKRVGEIQHVCDPRCRDLTDLDAADLIDTAQNHGLAHTPTLVVYDGQLAAYDSEGHSKDPRFALMPRVWRDVVWTHSHRIGSANTPPEALPRRAALVGGIEGIVRSLHARGVSIYVGTDPFNPFVVPGASVHEEMRLLTRLGFTPEEALAAATNISGAALPEPGLGRLEVGAPADLLLFHADPTRDLGALSTLDAVVVDGRVYPKEEIDALALRQRRYFENPVFDAVSVPAARALVWLLGRTDF